MKQAIITIIVVAVIIGGAVIFGKSDEVQGTPSNNYYGQEEGIVTLTEYGDFECPACAAFFPIVSQIKELYKDQIRFEFRHFPLVQIHPNAQAAHRAAEAAGKQGKFWEMHDLLYQRQASWRSTGGASNNPSAIFEGYAQELNLNMEQYNADIANSSTLATINADIELGKKAGVSGTPTFILDGVKIEDSASIDSVEKLSALINEAIDKKSGEQPAEQSSEQPSENSEPAKPEENSDSVPVDIN